MSTKNQISIHIPPAVLAEATEKLQEVTTLLAPFLQGLTPDQRETIFKMGNKTIIDVTRCAKSPDFEQQLKTPAAPLRKVS